MKKLVRLAHGNPTSKLISMKKIMLGAGFFALMLLLGNATQAQVSVSHVIDEDGNHIWWTALYQCDGSRSTKESLDQQVKDKAKEKYPDAKNILVEGSNGCGYLVIVKSEWTGKDNFIRKKYGVSVGEDYEDALKIALDDLKTHDRSWKKKNGFEVKQSLQLN